MMLSNRAALLSAMAAVASAQFCPGSPNQQCRMLCRPPTCAADECLMRSADACCELTCQAASACDPEVFDSDGNCVTTDCVKWNDGCNECTLSVVEPRPALLNGRRAQTRVAACTERACLRQGNPFCIETAAGAGATGEADEDCPDVNLDGVINVNDILDVLSAFGGTDKAADITDDGTVNVNDLLGLLSKFGTECTVAGGGGGACARGDDCGGQVWTECGSACPATCGEQAGFCTFNCVAGFFCPAGKMYDPIGLCVDPRECSVEAPELPPGIALGRPFTLGDMAVPAVSGVVEMESDWAL